MISRDIKVPVILKVKQLNLSLSYVLSQDILIHKNVSMIVEHVGWADLKHALMG
jgi:hypothetical protein